MNINVCVNYVSQLFTVKTPDEVKDLVMRYNANTDCRNTACATPLIVHTMAGRVDIVKKLIQLRANVDLQDNNGYSALMLASKAGHIELVRLLISSGAILDLKEKQVSTLSHCVYSLSPYALSCLCVCVLCVNMCMYVCVCCM